MTKTSIKEPTLHDVMYKLSDIDTRLGTIETNMGSVEKNVNGLNVEVQTMNTRLTDVERSVSKLVVVTTDIQEDLAGALKATDDNALKIINHERRIRVMEKVHAKR